MASTVLPFAFDSASVADFDRFRARLPKGLAEACERSPHLAEYLRRLPLDEVGIPGYYTKLTRSMSEIAIRNLIYPLEQGLYVHIYPDKSGARDHYICIEPTTVIDIETPLVQVEERLIAWAEDIGRIENDDDKRAFLLKLVDAICTTQRRNGNRRADKIYVTPDVLEGIRYRILRDKIGLGMLQPLLMDPYIEDISCSGVGHVFVEHKIFKSVQSSIVFTTHDEVDDFVVWLGEWIKSPVTVRNPLVDSVLPDGSRINIVYGREISKRGSNFTIRKFSDVPTSVIELIEFGTLNYTMASYLSFILEEGLNMFVVGATASGKTTTLNALSTFLKPDAKIVTIEDTPEVHVPHKNWVQEVSRPTTAGAKGGEVGMFELLRAALRQRPDRIIVGEIRSMEAVVAFQAMQTGHGVMSTFHANSVEKLIQRLTDAAEPLKDIGVPYGFAAQEWAELKQEVAEVVAVASGEEPEDDGAVDAYIDDDDGEQSDEDDREDQVAPLGLAHRRPLGPLGPGLQVRGVAALVDVALPPVELEDAGIRVLRDEGGRQVDREGGLPDPAFGICDADYHVDLLYLRNSFMITINSLIES